MRRILFQWHSLKVWSYPAMLYLGLVIGVVAGNVAAHAAGLDAWRVFVAMLLLILCGLIGARLFFVIPHWRLYRQDLRELWTGSQGGAAHYGGLAVAFPLSVPLVTVFRLPLGAFWDVAVFTMLFTAFFARIGCLLNGCCAGRSYSGWGSAYLPNHRGVWERRIPTQILEAAWAGILLVSAGTVWRWMRFPGALFLVFAAVYGSGRLVLISMTDSSDGDGLAFYYGFSLLLVACSLALLIARWPT